MRSEPGILHTNAQEHKMATDPVAAPAPAPAAGQVVSAVEADASAVESKLVAFLKKAAPYAAGLVVGVLVGHFA